jgi:hypothetical protein
MVILIQEYLNRLASEYNAFIKEYEILIAGDVITPETYHRMYTKGMDIRSRMQMLIDISVDAPFNEEGVRSIIRDTNKAIRGIEDAISMLYVSMRLETKGDPHDTTVKPTRWRKCFAISNKKVNDDIL